MIARDFVSAVATVTLQVSMPSHSTCSTRLTRVLGPRLLSKYTERVSSITMETASSVSPPKTVPIADTTAWPKPLAAAARAVSLRAASSSEVIESSTTVVVDAGEKGGGLGGGSGGGEGGGGGAEGSGSDDGDGGGGDSGDSEGD